LARVVVATAVAQLLAGVLNLLLLAPIGMQLAHLLLANLLWIALVVLCGTADGPSGIPVAGSQNHSSAHALYVVGTNSGCKEGRTRALEGQQGIPRRLERGEL
jgi:hypothetical protein